MSSTINMIKIVLVLLSLTLFTSCGLNDNIQLLENQWFYSTEDDLENSIPLDRASINSLPQYLNGELIGRTGSFPPEWFSDWNRDRQYDIPAKLVRWDGKNELLIQIYVNYEGQMDRNIQIGLKEEIDSVYSYNSLFHKDIHILFSFLLFFFGLYHLFIYSRRRKDKDMFWFALVSITFSFCQSGLFLSSLPGFQYSQISIIPFMKIIGIFELLLTYSFIRFTEYFFRIADRPALRRIIYAPTLILMIMYLLQVEFGSYKIFFAYFEISLIIPSFYVIYLTILAHRKQQRGARVFIICLIPTILLILHDAILPNMIEGYNFLTIGIGLSLLLVIINMVLGLDFVRDRNEAEILNIELEQKVYKRTSELKDANERLSFASRKESFIQSYDLSKRESEILNLLLDGLSNDEMADDLDISIRTVSAHLYKMYKKMNVHSRLEIFSSFRES